MYLCITTDRATGCREFETPPSCRCVARCCESYSCCVPSRTAGRRAGSDFIVYISDSSGTSFLERKR